MIVTAQHPSGHSGTSLSAMRHHTHLREKVISLLGRLQRSTTADSEIKYSEERHQTSKQLQTSEQQQLLLLLLLLLLKGTRNALQANLQRHQYYNTEWS
ncbi:unnamed protein product [Rangifer tarandus platyrhynchus]|uniref:Uncharacterized protein n=1 Tax=Rangifer tarandus platyrhynchus TaxID=3082113 RepID=A0ABN8XKA1_RANTA|nr:unnamed protein product [Rangifer tarandus platyrhynchus]